MILSNDLPPIILWPSFSFDIPSISYESAPFIQSERENYGRTHTVCRVF